EVCPAPPSQFNRTNHTKTRIGQRGEKGPLGLAEPWRGTGLAYRATSLRPLTSNQPPNSLLRMLPPLAHSTRNTPISDPPAPPPNATAKVNHSASSGSGGCSKSKTRPPRNNKTP